MVSFVEFADKKAWNFGLNTIEINFFKVTRNFKNGVLKFKVLLLQKGKDLGN